VRGLASVRFKLTSTIPVSFTLLPAKRNVLAQGYSLARRGLGDYLQPYIKYQGGNYAKGKCHSIKQKRRAGRMAFRWSERDMTGHRVYRKRVIGTVEQYPDADAVRAAMSALISEANVQSHGNCVGSITIDQLCEHFEQSEMRPGIAFGAS
jgi:hypothetical protein